MYIYQILKELPQCNLVDNAILTVNSIDILAIKSLVCFLSNKFIKFKVKMKIY